MKMRKRLVLVSFLVSLTATAAPDPSWMNTLKSIEQTFQDNYAMKAVKARFFGWNLKTVSLHAEASLQALGDQPPLPAAKNILFDFFQSTRDDHVTAVFNSNAIAQLPIGIRSANHRYFLVFIDRTVLPVSNFPFEIGDEILSYGGKPIDSVVHDYYVHRIIKYPRFDQSRIEDFLTFRGALIDDSPPETPTVELKILSHHLQQPRSVTLKWIQTANAAVRFAPVPRHEVSRKGDSLSHRILAHISGSLTQFPASLRSTSNPVNLFSIWYSSSKKSYLPDFGKVIWRADESNTFSASIVEIPGIGRVGVVRIPSYQSSNYSKLYADFDEIIGRFEGQTQALIIDQIHNGGGSVLHVNQLVSRLIRRPLSVPRFSQILNADLIASAIDDVTDLAKLQSDDDARKDLGDFFIGQPVNLAFARLLQAFEQEWIDDWKIHHLTFTKPQAFANISTISPASIHYSKPILTLVNEYSASGGDFFPAMLQDSGQSKIFGIRTAGAGGFVTSFTAPSGNPFALASSHVTVAIGFRSTGELIENTGVKPDYEYALSPEDLTQGFSRYRFMVQKTLKNMLGQE